MGAGFERMLAVMHTTDGWPRHLHWAQQALAEAVLKPAVNGDLDRITDWDWVQARSNELRHGYYDTQFSDEMDISRKLVARVMCDVGHAQAAGQGLRIDDIHATIRSLSEYGSPNNLKLPEGFSPESFTTHLIHCGALQMNSNRSLSCPIPSFQSYIIRQGELDPDPLQGCTEHNPS